MAGSQDPDENPVAINVVPMVDVIFCLCVFFMCSFKFKEVEGRFDAWLPKDLGPEVVPELVADELRVAVRWDERTNSVTRQFGSRRVTSDAEAAVPCRDVVTIINLCKRERIERIEFAYGTGQ